MHMKVTREVQVSAEKCWEMLGDFSNVHHIHPLVQTSTPVTENDRGLGAIRECELYDGNSVQEKVIEWDEENMSYTFNLEKGKLPLTLLEVKVSVEANGATQSLLACDVDFDPKYGFIGKLLGHFLMKPKLGGVLGDMLGGVKYYLDEGEDVPENWNAPGNAVIVS
mmetsp:Transcript_38473/g.151851  ORF Transcript_38473/g.151851 Transcript_38473/m.151851 type:complete len:166 (+) Transcript_38473:156-653(+)|eukprot:CAMPEP_0113957672 /NCGR_PEP_ID=MMETSP0011_2-20120614/2910_1 /TAXON_ID=101924 /ORGANISM="Rhodosorus marinus" /LENGTH=165 /DNA_ID=CAMNT_0000968281 /DNA_START=105 /DNA_END=602 /DNA_ORIENTATION=- /assembly_acc=CAM_ASM_000156